MNHTIIGTAGHVDHGKTSLIKALTGVECDRLQEEKSRGITIELGFASLIADDGEKIGIIDVPGHEKFVGNMLAGAGGIDIALMVVAADEGFMPQTREHLSILSLLGIQKGIIALTKTDLVEKEWLEMVTEEIREEVKGTFLENSLIIPVSSSTGEGIDTLKNELLDNIKNLNKKNFARSFRLPIDRVFSMDGFGTVVTGTLIEGKVSENDDIEIFPSGTMTKIRNIQVHGESVKTAYAGQRVALNLAGIKKAGINRGDVLGTVGSMQNTAMLDVRLDVLKECCFKIVNGSRLHLYHGSAQVLCRLVLMDKDYLSSGESGYAQLRLEEEICAKKGDRFVVRFYSPVVTVGGGVILDPLSGRRRRNNTDYMRGFEIKDTGKQHEIIERIILEHSEEFASFRVMRKIMFNEENIDGDINGLIAGKVIFAVADDVYIHRDYLDKLYDKGKAILSAYHADNPLHSGIRKDEFRTKLLPDIDQIIVGNIIKALVDEGKIVLTDNRIALRGFKVSMTEEHMQIANDIEKLYFDAGFAFPTVDEAAEKFSKKIIFKQTLEVLINNGVLIMLNPQLFIHASHFDKALEMLRELQNKQGDFTLAQFRDMIGTSRKYAVSILEYMDAKKISIKKGDVRTLL